MPLLLGQLRVQMGGASVRMALKWRTRMSAILYVVDGCFERVGYKVGEV